MFEVPLMGAGVVTERKRGAQYTFAGLWWGEGVPLKPFRRRHRPSSIVVERTDVDPCDGSKTTGLVNPGNAGSQKEIRVLFFCGGNKQTYPEKKIYPSRSSRTSTVLANGAGVNIAQMLALMLKELRARRARRAR